MINVELFFKDVARKNNFSRSYIFYLYEEVYWHEHMNSITLNVKIT